MNKAQEILVQSATQSQKLKWAEGNAVYHEHDTNKGIAEFHFADGSKIISRPLVGVVAA